MKLEIDMPEHHYNNIIAFDSVSLGRVPYKGIIMYAINAIKHGKVLEQEPFINKPCVSSGVCEHDKQKVLEKIRAEIEARLCDVVSDYTDGYRTAIQGDLAVIDKYKAETEADNG